MKRVWRLRDGMSWKCLSTSDGGSGWSSLNNRKKWRSTIGFRAEPVRMILI